MLKLGIIKNSEVIPMSLSRVEKYAELRKRIDNMVSTFDDPITDNKIPDVQMDEPKVKEEAMTKEEVQEAHIKKNTLSISIDELIKQHEEYTQTISKSEIENQMKTQKKEHNFTRLLFIILLIVVIIVAVFVGLLLGGVMKEFFYSYRWSSSSWKINCCQTSCQNS